MNLQSVFQLVLVSILIAMLIYLVVVEHQKTERYNKLIEILNKQDWYLTCNYVCPAIQNGVVR